MAEVKTKWKTTELESYPGHRIKLSSAGSFKVYAITMAHDDVPEQEKYLGPWSFNDRYMAFTCPVGVDFLRVVHEDQVDWDIGPPPAEFNDGVPVAMPVEMDRPLTLHEQVVREVAMVMSRQAHRQDEGIETFEEANDFAVDEDPDQWTSPYEYSEMQDETPVPVDERRQEAVARAGSPQESTPVPDSPSAEKTPHVASEGV